MCQTMFELSVAAHMTPILSAFGLPTVCGVNPGVRKSILGSVWQERPGHDETPEDSGPHDHDVYRCQRHVAQPFASELYHSIQGMFSRPLLIPARQ